jgi:hypothetical protein
MALLIAASPSYSLHFIPAKAATYDSNGYVQGASDDRRA